MILFELQRYEENLKRQNVFECVDLRMNECVNRMVDLQQDGHIGVRQTAKRRFLVRWACPKEGT